MKDVKLRDGATFKTKNILTEVLRMPGRGIDLEEMRRRCRVLGALEKATGSSVLLEDADFDVLKAALQANQWGVADIELMSIIDEVLGAKAPDTEISTQ